MSFSETEIDWNYLLEKLESLMDLGEEYLSRQIVEYKLDTAIFTEYSAFRWEDDEGGYLIEITHPDIPAASDLIGIEENLKRLRQNTLRFIKGLPANDILLWGARGTGKSSAVRALLGEFANQGLRMIEVDKEGLCQLPLIVETLRPLPYRFILFCHDLSFDDSDRGLCKLMRLLDGGLQARPDNMRVYATSICRQTDSERFENRKAEAGIQADTGIAGRLALSDRFGITLEFPPIDEDDYLAIVRHLAQREKLSLSPSQLDNEARRWTQGRGALSGRVARQFISDLSGRLAMEKDGVPPPANPPQVE